VVPIQAGESIGAGLLSRILRDAKMTRDDLQGLL
jgi:predicted RNA binding protein YcfA (HicA-like mRNA interferase family)